MKKFYVTTPIYYVNSVPTVGSAYTTIVADVLARWHRLNGDKTFYLTGLDENSAKTVRAAEKAGYQDVQKYMDDMAEKWKEAWKKLDISYDGFIRTSEPRHKKVVQEVFNKLNKKGDLYKGKYEGYYCDDCEAYLNENDLVEGKCPAHKREPEYLVEDNYFFRLSRYQNEILEILKNKDFLLPESRRNEMINFVESGLKDISVSRQKSKIGVEVPFDKSMKSWCWIDALFNYVSGSEKNFPQDLCLIGKDITRFHAVFFIGFLLSAGYKIPKTIFAHGFLTINGQKISKSLGNAIDPIYLVDKYGLDSIRYFLLREIPFGGDGDFSEEALIERNNNELANELGNLINRTVGMVEKYYGGKFKKGKSDKELFSKLHIEQIKKEMDNYEFNNALTNIWKFIAEVNKYINDKKPWENEKERVDVLYNVLDSIRIISILVSSFIPETSQKINEQIGVKAGSLKEVKQGLLKDGKIKKGELLFKKIEVKNA